jgi:hypothetical protein
MSNDVTDQDRSKLSPTSMLPSLKYIDDPSLFDLDALTCHACNKSFKNTRAFKLHRDRHQVKKNFHKLLANWSMNIQITNAYWIKLSE